MQIPELDAVLVQPSQQLGNPVLILLTEGIHQGMTVFAQLHRQAARPFRQRGQRLLQMNCQLPSPQFTHQRRLLFHQHQLTFGDYPDAVGHFLGLFDVMRGQDDGHAVVAQASYHLPHVATQRDVDARRRLIEKQHRRLVRERLGYQHAALHTAGEIHDPLVALVPQRQVTQDLLDERLVGRFAEQATAEVHRRPYRVEHVIGQLLRHQPDQ